MEKRQKIIAFIPLRAGSKRIKNKNIKEIAGRPLAYWVLDAACTCELIDEVYVATDSPTIANTIKAFGNKKVHIVARSKESSAASAQTEQAMLEFAKKKKFDHIVLIQATSPLLRSTDLSAGVNQYLKRQANGLISLVRQKRFIWRETDKGYVKPVNYEIEHRPRTQKNKGYLVENGAFYITSRQSLLESGLRVSGNISYYEMPPETYTELDDSSDWVAVESLLLARKTQDVLSSKSDILRNIKLLVMDVDGVLTDTGMRYYVDKDESKTFSTLDGKGIELIRNAGIKTAFLTGENTRIVEERGKKLRIDFILQGVEDKLPAIKKLAKELRIDLVKMAYIGDDINDISAMKEVGFSATPADSSNDNKKIASYVCAKNGGQGCVREVCDLLINVRRNQGYLR